MRAVSSSPDKPAPTAKYASIQRLSTDSEWDLRVILKAARDYGLPLILCHLLVLRLSHCPICRQVLKRGPPMDQSAG